MTEENQIKVSFLGTGTSTGVPVIACNCPACKSNDFRDTRLRTSVLIQVNNKKFVIDCGPDFRQQMLKANVDDINAVLLTHEHRDHTSGLDDLRAFNYILNKPIELYATEKVINSIKTQFPYIFEEKKYIGALRINIHLIDKNPFNIEGVTFIPIEVKHKDMTVLGFRIGDFTYITDASFISEDEKNKIKGSKVVVINALRKSKHISHFSISEAVDFLNEIKPERGYLTHLSHFAGLHKEIEEATPPFIHPANDGLTIFI